MTKQDEKQRQLFMLHMRDLEQARHQWQNRQKAVASFLKTNTRVKAAYDAFVEAGGGTFVELKEFLASYKPLPSLAQKKHMRLVVRNEPHHFL